MLEPDEIVSSYNAVYDALGDGVLIVDYPALTIQHGNRAAQTCTGFSLDSLRQLTLPDLFVDLDAEAIAHHIAELSDHTPIRFRATLNSVTEDTSAAELQLSWCQFDHAPGLACLIRDIGEQQAIEDQLHTHELLYRSLVDGIPDLLFRIRRDGTYLDYKVPTELGLPIPESVDIVGKTIGQLMPPHINAMAMEAIEKVFETGAVHAIEYQIKEPNGLHDYEARFAPSVENEVLAIVRDITERKRAEALSAMQRDLGIALSTETTLERALQRVLDAVIDGADMDGGGIYLVDHGTGAAALASHKGLSGDFVRTVSHLDAGATRARIIQEGRPVYLSQQDLMKPAFHAERQAGLRSIAVIPIRHRHEIIACLNLASCHSDHIPATARTMLETIAAQTGSAIARIKIEEALRESEKTTRDLLNALPDLALLLNETGSILAINDTAAHRFDSTTNALTGTRLMSRSPLDIDQIRQVQGRQVFDSGRPLSFEVENEGTHFAVVIHPLFDSHAPDKASRIAIIARDVTSHKQAEQALLYQRTLLEAIAQATTRLLAGDDHATSIQEALALLGEATHTDRVVVFTISPESSPASPVSSLRYEWASSHITTKLVVPVLQNLRWKDFGLHAWYHTLAAGGIICESTPTIFDRPGIDYRLDSLATLLLIPIFVDDRLWGCLGFVDQVTHRHWPAEEINVIKAMAASIGAAVERQQAEDKLRHEREVAETLREVGTVLNSTLDLNEVLRLLLDQAKRVVKYDSANVMLVKDNTGRVVSSANYEAIGLSEAAIREQRFPLEDYPNMRKMITSGVPRVISDVTTDPDWIAFPGTEWIKSWLGVPILIRGEVIGFFSLDSACKGFYGPEHVNMIAPFARQAAIACDNAWLYQQIHEQAGKLSIQLDQLDTLYQAGKSILSTLELDEILARFAEQITHIADAQSTIIYGYSSDGQTGVIRTIHDRADECSSHRPIDPAGKIDISTAVVRNAIASGHSTILMDEQLSAAFPNSARTSESQSVMLVPLANKDRTIGLVVISDNQPNRRYTLDQRRMCEALATQAAIALEQAMLFADIQQLEHTKSQMIRMASHDLRSPLTRVQGHVQRLMDQLEPQMTADQKNDLAGIDDAARHMVQIIDDILSLERIEAKHRAAKPIDWGDLIQDCTEVLHTELQAKRHTLTVDCSRDLAVVCGDEVQIKRAIFNLIHNAIKYTPEDGSITVRVFEKEYGGSPTLAFEVADTGIGIPPEQQKELFQPFYRAQQAEAHGIAGTGLGLSIVKSAVELHEGNVYWDSIPGQGSTFGFWIPIWPGNNTRPVL